MCQQRKSEWEINPVGTARGTWFSCIARAGRCPRGCGCLCLSGAAAELLQGSCSVQGWVCGVRGRVCNVRDVGWG